MIRRLSGLPSCRELFSATYQIFDCAWNGQTEEISAQEIESSIGFLRFYSSHIDARGFLARIGAPAVQPLMDEMDSHFLKWKSAVMQLHERYGRTGDGWKYDEAADKHHTILVRIIHILGRMKVTSIIPRLCDYKDEISDIYEEIEDLGALMLCEEIDDAIRLTGGAAIPALVNRELSNPPYTNTALLMTIMGDAGVAIDSNEVDRALLTGIQSAQWMYEGAMKLFGHAALPPLTRGLVAFLRERNKFQRKNA